MYNLYCATSPYITVGADAARFFLYGWRRDPLLCHPPLHYCWGRCCPFFLRLAARSSTVPPPLTLLLGQMLPVFYTVGGAILYCATPPYATVGADAARFLYGWLRHHLRCSPAPTLLLGQKLLVFYTVGVLGDPPLFYPPTLHLG